MYHGQMIGASPQQSVYIFYEQNSRARRGAYIWTPYICLGELVCRLGKAKKVNEKKVVESTD